MTVLITVVVCLAIGLLLFAWFFIGPYLNNRK